MRIDSDGNMELTAEENQDLMDRLGVSESEYDDPPVEIECVGVENGIATFKATNTKTGRSVQMVFDLMEEED
jgi:hypothetical protein